MYDFSFAVRSKLCYWGKLAMRVDHQLDLALVLNISERSSPDVTLENTLSC